MARSLRLYKTDLSHDLTHHLLTFGEPLAAALGDRIVSFIDAVGEKPRLFGIKVCREGVTGLRFDIKAALFAAVALVGGVAGANHISAGAAVVSCLYALHEGTREVPDVLARIILLLHESGGSAPTAQLAAALQKLGAIRDNAELGERLMDLQMLGALKVQGETASLEEMVVVRYRERVPPQSNPVKS